MVLKKKKAKKAVAKKRAAKRKIIRKKPLAKKALKPKRKIAAKPKEKVIGKVTHYFPKVNAAVIKLNVALAAGDSIKIKGHTSDFIQKITSMQIDHVSIDAAKKGDEIGLLVDSRVRQGDKVFKP
ncbi:MAG: hypothetical protein WC628_06370 [Candidatus Omnitrophota bacterium]